MDFIFLKPQNSDCPFIVTSYVFLERLASFIFVTRTLFVTDLLYKGGNVVVLNIIFQNFKDVHKLRFLEHVYTIFSVMFVCLPIGTGTPGFSNV